MATAEQIAIQVLQAFIDQYGGGSNLASGAPVSDFVFEMIQDVSDLMSELYTDVIRIKNTTYTRTNPWEEATTETEIYDEVRAAVFGTDPLRREHMVSAQAKYAIVAATDLVTQIPDVDKLVEINGEEFAIKDVAPVPAGTNRAVYIIQFGVG